MGGLIYADLKIKRKWMIGVLLISWAIVIIVPLFRGDPQDPIDALFDTDNYIFTKIR